MVSSPPSSASRAERDFISRRFRKLVETKPKSVRDSGEIGIPMVPGDSSDSGPGLLSAGVTFFRRYGVQVNQEVRSLNITLRALLGNVAAV